MAEIIKVYRQSLPDMRFVGRCYTEADRKDGTFSHKWGEWFGQGLFEPLELKGTDEPFEDCNAYYGLCRCNAANLFEYWIGVFLPADAAVPEGYASVDFGASDVAVCWVQGKEPDIYFADTYAAIREKGYEWKPDVNGTRWCFERYVCPRFTTPDENGNVILDMCFYI